MTDPTTSPPPDLRRLIVTIDTLSVGLEDTSRKLDKVDRQTKWARAGATIGIAAAIIGIVYGVAAKTTTDDLAAQRNESRVSSCIQQNVTLQANREALIRGVSVLAADPDGNRTPAAQERVDEFIRSYTEQVKKALPFRDCSAAGIAAYFTRPPRDPALGG